MVAKVQTAVITDVEGHVKGGGLDFIRFVLDHSSSAVLEFKTRNKLDKFRINFTLFY